LGVDSLNKTLSLSGQLYLDEGGSPGTTYQPYTDARKKDQNKSANISYDQRVGSIYNTLHVGGYYHNFESWYDSPSALFPYTRIITALPGELKCRDVLSLAQAMY